MSRKHKKRQDRIFKILIALLCTFAFVLMFAIAVQSRLNRIADANVFAPSTPTDATPAPMTVISADSQLNSVDSPEAAVTATPKPEATPESFEYLPVYTKVETSEKVIAITLDDCSDIASLKNAAKAAYKSKAKLTLLPIASNMLTDEGRAALQHCVFTLGYQIENRTLNNRALYTLDDFSLANEIWTADMAIDYALDMDYGMHLLRTKGGLGTQDPRTHTYLKQLGYDGFLNWSVEAARYTTDELKSGITPGEIYLFNCTQTEVEKMVEFMDFAESLGYRMVTVNELLGFAENSCTEPESDILSRTIVELENFDAQAMDYTDCDRAYGIYLLQKMLYEMGYLTGDTTIDKLIDGVLGSSTRSAIMAFQAQRNMPCTGVASAEIQALVRAEHARLTAQQ